VSIESIKNTRNHNHLIEDIRKMTSLERANWNIKISWIKAHVGVVGNELADRLAKAVASDDDTKIAFNRLPMCSLISKIVEETQLNWQKEWEECTKAQITKEFFPKVQDRQKNKDRCNPHPHSDGDRPRENQVLSPPLQNSRESRLPLW
jgi:hypothetical protein